MKENVLEKLSIKENHERECKLATGGLPESIWETYSSFANTNGGTILLGIKEHRDSFTVEGLTDKQIVKYQKDFWSTLNDRNKVSKNILLNHHMSFLVLLLNHNFHLYNNHFYHSITETLSFFYV